VTVNISVVDVLNVQKRQTDEQTGINKHMYSSWRVDVAQTTQHIAALYNDHLII